MREQSTFIIDADLPPEFMKDLLRQVQQYYLLPHKERFRGIRQTSTEGVQVLQFTATDDKQAWSIEVEVRADSRVEVRMSPSPGTPPAALDAIRDDLTTVVRTVERGYRQSMMYFVWVKGERIVPEEVPTTGRRIIERLFSSALLLIYMFLFAFNIILFLFFGFGAVLVVIGVQLVLVLFADRIYLTMGKWRITDKNPEVYLLQLHLSDDELRDFVKNHRRETVRLKAEIYARTFAQGREPTCELLQDILVKYGIICSPERLSTKVVNVQGIVKRAAEDFHLPVPKIVVSNSLMPNAAATGPSPNRGVILITGGLLLELNDEEVLSVVGHELGHLKGRDPLLLFGLTSGEFLIRVTILLPLFLAFPLLYLIVALAGIFFVAKFFEARADLLSAMEIGQPKVLAEALTKIGFQRLRYERSPSHRLGSWIRFDPHPPLYFRIERLDQMVVPVKVKHPLIQSAKDVFRGFRSAL